MQLRSSVRCAALMTMPAVRGLSVKVTQLTGKSVDADATDTPSDIAARRDRSTRRPNERANHAKLAVLWPQLQAQRKFQLCLSLRPEPSARRR